MGEEQTETAETTAGKALSALPGSTFQWIVDRPPTKEDADSFGYVACAKRGSAFTRVDWQECANGFIRPWARTRDAINAKMKG